MTTAHDFTVRDINGADVPLSTFDGKVLLIVNVASKCGLTPQYEGLEALHREYGPRGLVVLGFPCNQFMGQEPGTNDEIKLFCAQRYDVTFPLFDKVDVNGDTRAPLYAFLTSQKAGPEGAGDVAWNFGKFLVGKYGAVLARFSPKVAPTAPELREAIERALA